VLHACKILAFDGVDAAGYQNTLINGLKRQLTRCATCVREYHRARGLLEQDLVTDYDMDEVEAFMKKFDHMNITRIIDGLNNMTESLYDLPPAERKLNKVGEVATYALFEALHCRPFLRDEMSLQQYFDKPFRLLQTVKKVSLPSYVPGMAAFLFSEDETRRTWAERNFAKVKRSLTPPEFEHSVKSFVESAAAKVHINSLDTAFLPRFWKALGCITQKLTKDLIPNNFRVMDVNIYTLAMEHWQIDGAHFTDMILCHERLLTLSPSDFWEAMGGINGQHVAEQILRSPALQKLLTTPSDSEPRELQGKFSWISPFLHSIKPANLVPPVRTVLDHLLNTFRGDSYTDQARNVSWDIGLRCVLEAMKLVRSAKGGPTFNSMLELVARDHIQAIMEDLDRIERKTEMELLPTEQLCLDIVEGMVGLEVQLLAHGREQILRTKALDYEIRTSGLNGWRVAMRKVEPGGPLLPTAIASGLTGLITLEKFSTRQVNVAAGPTQSWNDALERTVRYVQRDFLERLAPPDKVTFNPDQLIELYQEQKAAQGLIALLFNSDSRIHNATLDVFKVLSGEDNRRDTVMHLLKVFFSTTLSAVAKTEQKVAHARGFGPCSNFLKLGTDIVDCLCDSGDGLLRSQTVSKQAELQALEQFWQMTWTTLEMIFSNTEGWSNLGYDKQAMIDFCRATMGFAELIFDQYSIFASTLYAGRNESGSRDEVGKQLLAFPTKAFDSIAKWLRLRDDWLINTAVVLTCKMLGRLQEVGIRVDENAALFIEDVVTSTDKRQKVKTKLSDQQKAQLQRALEKHTGMNYDIVDVDALPPRKQSTLEAWASSGSGSGRSTPVNGARPPKPGVIDLEQWSAKSDAEKQTRRTAEEHEKAYADIISSASRGSAAFKEMQARKPSTPATQKAAQKHQADSNNFLLKRKQEKEAAEKRKQEMLSKQKLGVGSGVNGLGDIGKDHTLKGQNVMISSDEESSDDEEDELDEDLFGPKKDKKIKRPDVDPNGALGLRPEVKKGPVRIQRTARSMKDMRARLAPDLQPLHKIILKWDYFHDGDYPPGAPQHQFKGVANSYLDPVTYQSTFEPLLILEAWQGMVKSREENSNKPYDIKIQNRTNVDNFIEVSSLVTHVENRELSLGEGDIILLSKSKKPSEDNTAPHSLARICKMKRQKANIEVIYQLMPGTSLASGLTMQATVWGQKIQSITPLEREFGALQGLQYYDLCQQIIKAAPSRRINFSDKQIAACQDVWNVNRAQSEAINAALENEGFSLIQGPPGSGKTKTIIAIVGGLLSQTLAGSSNGAIKISMPRASGAANVGGDGSSRKLLVCAPSNAAVDELVMRLKQGVKTRSGKHYPINVVRIGRSENINTQVLDVTMEELVAKRIGGNDNDMAMRTKNAELFKDHEGVSAVLRELYQKRDSGEVKGKGLTDLETEISTVRRRKNELGVRIDNVKDNERTIGREAELNRKRAQQAVLDEAHVICATLSGSGHDMFQSLNIEFETVIIDEAAQCVEMSSLIPLKYGCVKCIMVGDPKQLPPTVFSKEAAKFQYEQSLFVRMQNNFAEEVHLLDTQYRMHPDISLFPSRTFYDGLLKDGDGMAGLRQRPWHASALLAPYRFFDVKGQHQSAKGHSLINVAEVQVAMAIFDRLRADFRDYDYTGRIGVITPYKSQLRLLKERFSQNYGNDIFDIIEFNTTDAFQGRESEIIIFSCVRASPAGGIGFLQDIRRMNVGLTRAKSSLWVLGNSDSLVRGQYWKKLVEDAQARDAYSSGDVMGMLRKPSSAFPAETNKTLSMYDVGSHVPQMQNRASRPPDTSGSRRPSESTPAAADATVASDRMEGVRYRFEDRVATSKKRPATSDSGDDRNDRRGTPVVATVSHAAHKSTAAAADEDVKMADADSNEDEEGEITAHAPDRSRSGTATPRGAAPGGMSLDGGRSSRAETPLSAASGASGESKATASVANRVNGSSSVKPRTGAVAPPVAPAPQAMRKKPAASPFLPKKPKR
jgi:senataxin